MLQQYHTKLKGTLDLTDSYLTEKALQKHFNDDGTRR